MNAIADTQRKAPSQGWVLASLSLSMLMPSLDTSIANVGLPAMARAFAAPFQAMQWIVLAYLLAVTSLIVGAGRLGDMFGRRRLLLGGIALFTTASLLCGLAPSLAVLIAARAVQGVGAALMMALTLAAVGDSVPKDRTGSAMGLLGTMSAIGTTLGPSLGGVLISGFGWPVIFLVNVPLGIINMWMVWRCLPADAPRDGVRPAFDVCGTVLLAGALVAYALAVTVGDGRFGMANWGLLGLAAIVAAVFVAVEARVKSPLLRPAMLMEAALGKGLIMSALIATIVMSTLVIGPFYLAGGLGLKPAVVGLTMSAGPLMAALAGVPAGRIVDRIGSGRATVAGLGGVFCGTLALAVMPAAWGVTAYAGGIVVVTAGYALFQAANTAGVMKDVGGGQRGVVSGMLSLSRNLGLITGASAMGAVFAMASGVPDVTSADPAGVIMGGHVVFAVAAGLSVCALAVVMWKRRL